MALSKSAESIMDRSCQKYRNLPEDRKNEEDLTTTETRKIPVSWTHCEELLYEPCKFLKVARKIFFLISYVNMKFLKRKKS